MPKSIGIVGAGVMGRMLGVELAQRGWDVTLFDRDDLDVRGSCSWVGAGMIAPSCELESAEREISLLGSAAFRRWPEVAESLEGDIGLCTDGSLVVAHAADRQELERLRRRVRDRATDPEMTREVGLEDIRALEPELSSSFHNGLFMSVEGHLDNRKLLTALHDTLVALGATLRPMTDVQGIEPGRLITDDASYQFDWVADCRGMGAQDAFPTLRGVRGELLYLHAPEVSLSRPIRLMHPRYPIYVVPRADQVYVVGATAVESEDYSPISARSTMELLSAAYSLHSGFAEARLLETATSCRPALPNHRPQIITQDRLIRINGLYRHGFLVSPMLSLYAADFLEQGVVPADAKNLMLEAVA